MKRPAGVWLAFIWFGILGGLGLYQISDAYQDTLVPFLGRREQYNVIFTIASQLATFIAAILLFFRVAANRWIFLMVLIMGVISSLVSIIFVGLPPKQALLMIFFTILGIAVNAIIAWYSFALLKKGFYTEKHNKLKNENTSVTGTDVERTRRPF